MTADSTSVSVNSFVTAQIALSRHERFLQTIRQWRHRARTRRELAVLSDFDLRDIGYPAEVDAEKAKPFWRA